MVSDNSGSYLQSIISKRYSETTVRYGHQPLNPEICSNFDVRHDAAPLRALHRITLRKLVPLRTGRRLVKLLSGSSARSSNKKCTAILESVTRQYPALSTLTQNAHSPSVTGSRRLAVSSFPRIDAFRGVRAWLVSLTLTNIGFHFPWSGPTASDSDLLRPSTIDQRSSP